MSHPHCPKAHREFLFFFSTRKRFRTKRRFYVFSLSLSLSPSEISNPNTRYKYETMTLSLSLSLSELEVNDTNNRYWFGEGSSKNSKITVRRDITTEKESSTNWCSDRDAPSEWTRTRVGAESLPMGTFVVLRVDEVGEMPLRLYKIVTRQGNDEPQYNLRQIDKPFKLKRNVLSHKFTVLNIEVHRSLERSITQWNFWRPVVHQRRVPIPPEFAKKTLRLVKRNEAIFKRIDRKRAQYHAYWKGTVYRCLTCRGFMENILEFTSQNEILDIVIGVTSMSRSCFNSIHWRRLISACVAKRT